MSDFIENSAVQMDHAGFHEAVNALERLIEVKVSENELQKHGAMGVGPREVLDMKRISTNLAL